MDAETVLDLLYALVVLGFILAIPVTGITQPRRRQQLVDQWRKNPLRLIGTVILNGTLLALMVGFLLWVIIGTIRDR